MTEETKVCSRCKVEKHIIFFGNNKWYCKDCNSARCKEYAERRKQKAVNGYIKVDSVKICKTCGNEKPINQFGWLNKKLLSLQPSCLCCTNEIRRIQRINNKSYEMLKDARKRAKINGLDINIDESDIVIPAVCPVLGIPIVTNNKHTEYNSPSLDRIDSSKGYVKGNVMVISWRANAIKRDATLEEIHKIADYIERMTHLTDDKNI